MFSAPIPLRSSLGTCLLLSVVIFGVAMFKIRPLAGQTDRTRRGKLLQGSIPLRVPCKGFYNEGSYKGFIYEPKKLPTLFCGFLIVTIV